MPTFRFSGVDERYYTDLGVHAVPGETAEFDEAPDHLWEPADGTEPQPDDQSEPDHHEEDHSVPSDNEQKD